MIYEVKVDYDFLLMCYLSIISIVCDDSLPQEEIMLYRENVKKLFALNPIDVVKLKEVIMLTDNSKDLYIN